MPLNPPTRPQALWAGALGLAVLAYLAGREQSAPRAVPPPAVPIPGPRPGPFPVPLPAPSPPVSLLIVYGDACPPCDMLRRHVLADPPPLPVRWRHWTQAREMRVERVPTLILTRGGVEVSRIEGYLTPGALRAWLEASR